MQIENEDSVSASMSGDDLDDLLLQNQSRTLIMRKRESIEAAMAAAKMRSNQGVVSMFEEQEEDAVQISDRGRLPPPRPPPVQAPIV